MPISFLNPSLLLGAMAAALPVIIHFLSRRRVQRRPFSDLRFLDEVQSRQARSLGLKRWLLLLLRVLAILCVALAAAGPRWGGLGHGGGGRSVLFIIDNSASMNTGQEGGTRLDEALAVCGAMMRGLPGETAVQVLVSGSSTRPLFGDWLPAGSGAPGSLALVEPSAGPFQLEDACGEAARLVARAPSLPVQIILVSDLQDVPLSAEAKVAARRLRESGETNLLVRQVGLQTEGGGILAVHMPERAVRPGENVSLTAQVIPQFDEQVFSLEIEERPVAEVVTRGNIGQVIDITFPLTMPATGRYRGAVRKDSDAFPGDDVRPFVLEVPDRLEVLIAHGQDQPLDGIAGRGGWRYLAEALDPGATGAPFRTRSLTSGDLTTGAVTAADVVFLVDPDPLGRRALRGLLDWVSTGGQVVVMAGDPKLAGYLNSTLLPASGLPASASPAMAAPPGQRSRIVAADHPVFAGLDRAALQTFEEVAWRHWFRLPEGRANVLVSLVGDDPVLVEQALDEGRFVFMAGDLQPANGDLAGSPMALPFFRRLTAWLAGGAGRSALNIDAGQEAVLVLRDGDSQGVLEQAGSLVVRGAEGEASAAPALAWHGGQPELRGGQAVKSGYVTFLAGPDTLGIVAVATPAEESTLALQTVAEFGERLAELDLAVAADLGETEPDRLLATLGGRDLSGWLLLATLLLMAVELGVGRGNRG